ncbi:MAG: 4-hydroxy-3-methylbut-2-enyl diphosphate reductase [Dehalococcoidales bacterium]|nr:4-hydroxy-3-methylbut-2-enyl diphosphate reductase [Dehalococcoidales bacterium]
MRIEKAGEIGLCFGVRRTINILEKVARERGRVETLGPVVHNQQVLQRLGEIGVRVAKGVDDIQGDTVAIGSHGVSSQIEAEIQGRHIDIINTTCPFVRRAQIVARRLAESGFFVIIYGNADHPEVKGVLGWAKNRGVATLDERFIIRFDNLPRRLGFLSQTTQIPAHFTQFVKRLIDSTLVKDSELRIIDTICHDIRKRQAAALELANRVDLMLVIGARSSANTNCLAQLCSMATKTYLVEIAEEIQPSWLQGQYHIGITAGASTAIETVNEVLMKLEALAQNNPFLKSKR